MSNPADEAVRYALSELACECVRPDIDRDASIPELEAELVYAVGLYRGEEAARETQRLFEIASLR